MAEISPLPSAIPACPDPCVHPDRWALGGTLSPLHKAIHHHPPPVRPLLMIRSGERGPPVSRVEGSGEDFRRRHARHVNLKNTRTTSPLHNHTTPPPHHDLPDTGRLNRHPKKDMSRREPTRSPAEPIPTARLMCTGLQSGSGQPAGGSRKSGEIQKENRRQMDGNPKAKTPQAWAAHPPDNMKHRMWSLQGKSGRTGPVSDGGFQRSSAHHHHHPFDNPSHLTRCHRCCLNLTSPITTKSPKKNPRLCLSAAVAPLSPPFLKDNTKTAGPSRGEQCLPRTGRSSTRLEPTDTKPQTETPPTQQPTPPTNTSTTTLGTTTHGTFDLRRETLPATTDLASNLACPHPDALPPSPRITTRLCCFRACNVSVCLAQVLETPHRLHISNPIPVCLLARDLSPVLASPSWFNDRLLVCRSQGLQFQL